MTNLYSDAYIEHGNAYFRALNTDEQWQRELDFQNVDRYSDAARGMVGSCSQLRLLYQAKLRADQELREATEALRANGTPSEVQAVNELHSEQTT